MASSTIEPLEQTVEGWEKLYGLAEEAMLRDKEVISGLKADNEALRVRVARLELRLEKLRKQEITNVH